MEVRVLSREWEEGLDQMIQAQNDYRETFGEGSLDYVILGEPFPKNLTDLSESAKKLRDAIRTGVPLKNTPPNPDMPEIIY